MTGGYPSPAHPLAGATSTTDLTSLGPTTPVGSYEFFDSAGNRHEGTIADGGTIGATNSLQEFSAANTVYRAFKVAGDADLIASNIKDGVTIFGVAGNVTESPGLCGSNGSQSCVATGSFFAAEACSGNDSLCYLPLYELGDQLLKAIDYDAIDPDKMLTTQIIDGKTGTIVTRGSWNLTTTYPGDGYYTGTSNAPDASTILTGSTILGVPGSATPWDGSSCRTLGPTKRTDTMPNFPGEMLDFSRSFYAAGLCFSPEV